MIQKLIFNKNYCWIFFDITHHFVGHINYLSLVQMSLVQINYQITLFHRNWIRVNKRRIKQILLFFDLVEFYFLPLSYFININLIHVVQEEEEERQI